MKKFLVLLTVVLVGCQSAPVNSNDEITIDTIIMESDFTPPSEVQGERLAILRGKDPVVWDEVKLLSEQASEPDLLMNQEGKILLYYVGESINSSLAVAISDDAEAWVFKRVTLEGIPSPLSPVRDPEVIQLEDGSYRLYYTGQLEKEGWTGILYASSKDGLNFTYEGPVLFDEEQSLENPSVFAYEGGWAMLATRSSTGETIHAESSDGIDFTVSSIQSVNFAGTPTQMSNPLTNEYGTLNFFAFHQDEGISIFTASEEWKWTESGHTEVLGLDPSVLQLSDGTYLMAYSSEPVMGDPKVGLEDFLMTQVLCEDEACMDCEKRLYSDGMAVDLDAELYCNSSLWDALDPSRARYAYFSDRTLHIFDYASQSSNEMMTLLDTAEGASLFWSPSGTRLAVVAMNWNYENLTKVFILDLDPQGRLIDKNEYPLKVRFSCHSAGCNVLDGSFWFEDEKTLRYETWTGEDPYDESGVSMQSYAL